MVYTRNPKLETGTYQMYSYTLYREKKNDGRVKQGSKRGVVYDVKNNILYY